MEKIVFTAESADATTTEFFVVEQTKIGGVDYLLVTDSAADEDGEALILKDVSKASDTDAVYEFVVDETEHDAVAAVFGELLEDELSLVTF